MNAAKQKSRFGLASGEPAHTSGRLRPHHPVSHAPARSTVRSLVLLGTCLLTATLLADSTLTDQTVAAGQILRVADPVKINTAGVVAVQPAGVALLSAGVTVTLSPGFHATAGSFFRAVAGPTLGEQELTDSDGDGMPDAWEIDHGLNPYGYDAATDRDGDGIKNLAEYQNSQNVTLQQNAALGLAVFTPNF